MVTLNVVEDYRNGELFYPAGRPLVDLDDAYADWLMRDAPGCFEVAEDKTATKAVEKPAENKAVESAPKAKASTTKK